MISLALLAQKETRIGTLGGLGRLGLEGVALNKETIFALFNDVISTIIGVMTVVAGIYFLFLVIIAGYQWMTSGGDKAGMEAARNKLTYAIVGLVVVVLAFTLISLIGALMDIKFLQPGETLKTFPFPGGEE